MWKPRVQNLDLVLIWGYCCVLRVQNQDLVAATCPLSTSYWKIQLILIKDFRNGKGFFSFVLLFKLLKKKCQQCQLLLVLFEKNDQMGNENRWNARASCKFCIDKLHIWWQGLRKPPLLIKLISGLHWNLQYFSYKNETWMETVFMLPQLKTNFSTTESPL